MSKIKMSILAFCYLSGLATVVAPNKKKQHVTGRVYGRFYGVTGIFFDQNSQRHYTVMPFGTGHCSVLPLATCCGLVDDGGLTVTTVLTSSMSEMGRGTYHAF